MTGVADDPRTLYVDLLRRSIAGLVNFPPQKPIVTVEQTEALIAAADQEFRPFLSKLGHTVESYFDGKSHLPATPGGLALALNYMHPDINPDTMCEISTVNSLQKCVEDVLRDGIAGDLIETGVWKGGLTTFMRGMLKAHGVTDRTVWVADSFSGLPKPNPEENLDDAILYFLLAPVKHLEIPRAVVEKTFKKYGLLDDQVKFLPGWFSETLPAAPIESLAIMRLDGDWYESTKTALESLYPKLSVGGYVIIDDYGMPTGCRRAVDEFRKARQIEDEFVSVNVEVWLWRKSRA